MYCVMSVLRLEFKLKISTLSFWQFFNWMISLPHAGVNINPDHHLPFSNNGSNRSCFKSKHALFKIYFFIVNCLFLFAKALTFVTTNYYFFLLANKESKNFALKYKSVNIVSLFLLIVPSFQFDIHSIFLLFSKTDKNIFA